MIKWGFEVIGLIIELIYLSFDLRNEQYQIQTYISNEEVNMYK